ncbi:hypothetical protein GXW78_19970 [Roseomonas terrae]|uniref:Uncharacterized protein n=1 Tax=Neoroseomonas terrae TaxID=424799 RepID=A0ABS5ELS2_9PROT|nr:hypothetical protein [Neoroseomonas terrae]MBR0651953.1 hypothetical protein [Neoroseomonas terrae]
MAQPTARFDTWPLLPRRRNAAAERPAGEPLEAAAAALAGLAALFLVLRWAVPSSGMAVEVARQVALWGCLGGLALVVGLTALAFGVAIATPLIPTGGPFKMVALMVFDHIVHLAFVLTVAGLLGLIVLHGELGPIAAWFAGQALVLWGCHRARLWLAGPSIA